MSLRFTIAIFTAAALSLGCSSRAPEQSSGEPDEPRPTAPAVQQAAAEAAAERARNLIEVGYLELLRTDGAQVALETTTEQKAAVDEIQEATGVQSSAAQRHQAERELVRELLSAEQLGSLDRLYAAVKSVTTAAGPEDLGLVTSAEQNAQIDHLRKKWAEQAERLRQMAEQLQGDSEKDETVVKAILESKQETVEQIVMILSRMFATQTKPLRTDQRS